MQVAGALLFRALDMYAFDNSSTLNEASWEYYIRTDKFI